MLRPRGRWAKSGSTSGLLRMIQARRILFLRVLFFALSLDGAGFVSSGTGGIDCLWRGDLLESLIGGGLPKSVASTAVGILGSGPDGGSMGLYSSLGSVLAKECSKE